MLTLKLLKQLNACQEGIDFVVRNKLEGLPLEVIYNLIGNFGHLRWLQCHKNIKLDANGNMIQYTLYSGNITSFVYDDRNNTIQHTFTDGDVESWVYDDCNNMIQHCI